MKLAIVVIIYSMRDGIGDGGVTKYQNLSSVMCMVF